MLKPRPYFMENKDWYKIIEIGHWELTELGKSIPEVVKSFEEFFKDDDPFPDFSRQILKDAENSLREDYKKQGLTDVEIEQKINEWKYGTSDN